jgi:hypothetical protein
MIKPFFEKIDTFIPAISVDCVVFGYQENKLHVLLLKFKEVDAWAIPGGFVPADKKMEEVVHEVLHARTGLDHIFLDQFHTFSSPNRGWDSTEVSKKAFKQVMKDWKGKEAEKVEAWLKQRFITTAFIALINSEEITPIPDHASEYCTWIPVNNLPALILDHKEIIEKALAHLREKINYLPFGMSLLPKRFTMYQLQTLYEAITGKKEDRGNFQRKVMKLNVLQRHEKMMTGAQNKAPFLYSIIEEVYDELLKTGVGFL